MPGAVVLPRTRSRCRRWCASARGIGFRLWRAGPARGLSGGALPAEGGVVISFARMNRILAVDIANQRVMVEPGVINSHVTRRGGARMDISMRPTPRRRRCARSAATWRRTPAARTA